MALPECRCSVVGIKSCAFTMPETVRYGQKSLEMAVLTSKSTFVYNHSVLYKGDNLELKTVTYQKSPDISPKPLKRATLTKERL